MEKGRVTNLHEQTLKNISIMKWKIRWAIDDIDKKRLGIIFNDRMTACEESGGGEHMLDIISRSKSEYILIVIR